MSLPFPVVIGAATYTDAAVHDIYTVPAGKVVVLRQWQVANGGGASAFYTVYFTRAGVNHPVAPPTSVASSGVDVGEGYVVYYPGDKVSVAAASVGVMSFVLSGTVREV